MEPKQLKLGWTVSETIGVAVVNPRGLKSMNIITKNIFGNEAGSIDIRRYSIEIVGAVESAAKAFAEEILSKKIATPDYESWQYFDVIDIVYRNGEYILYLTGNGRGLIDPDLWMTFKKDVEKICRMKAFL